ncbi:hypothetical protein X566_00830 [Afipia sp. P52-10]|nr:hypothetical protein X566_00830 [Afipia sp. P52-10]
MDTGRDDARLVLGTLGVRTRLRGRRVGFGAGAIAAVTSAGMQAALSAMLSIGIATSAGVERLATGVLRRAGFGASGSDDAAGGGRRGMIGPIYEERGGGSRDDTQP